MSETHARTFVLADRLEQLADCVAHGPDVVRRNFTMQVPADPDRDADLVLSEAARLLRTSDAEITRLRDELETERLRLAACGVVALANTRESAKQAREVHEHYLSGSLRDVESAVDREMQLREQRDSLMASLKFVINHWREFGPKHGMDECIDVIDRELQALHAKIEAETSPLTPR